MMSRRPTAHIADYPSLLDGKILVAGKPLTFVDVEFLSQIGKGANAVVFSARDTNLDRPIAVKIWNSRGIARSREETAKIAGLNHPLFVTTHRFGRVGKQPFAIMEFVKGTSVKEWLLTNPPLDDRTTVWNLFSRAMDYLYKIKMVHGDPHTGNILVFSDEHNIFSNQLPRNANNLSVKVADVGTSAFWSSSTDFAKRESRLLLETASRLFHDQNLERLLDLSPKMPHTIILLAVNQFSKLVEILYFQQDESAKGLIADRLVDIVLSAPFFRIPDLLDLIKTSGATTSANRVISRLNASLLKISNVLEANNKVVTPRAQTLYDLSRASFLKQSLA